MTKATSETSANFWSGRSVFVTGASGIVGSWLVRELLERDALVSALLRDYDPKSELVRSGDVHRISVVSGGLEDFWTLERAINRHEPDTVFHLGAQPIVDVAHRFPLQTFEANIRGTYNLLEVCRIHSQLVKRVVIASSDKAYGAQTQLPYTEEMSLQGRHPYEVSKSCTDLISQCYSHTYKLPVAIARCGNIYGGGDLNWSRIVPATIRALLRGERPILRSDGTFLRDYTYVKDAVGAYLCLAEKVELEGVSGEAFNFSPEVPVSVLELVQHISRLMGREDLEPEIRNTAQGEIASQYLSAAKAHRLLGWKPQYELNEGLQQTIEWYKTFLAKTSAL
ncbi:CDP-glucose 4,6-dehydratase [Abditibacterium utsteinense]|uniref:CDP-glucose 4,6-dehydratase n=1 Tax=Abditibacterium utsteinense TaxID=1960156 RepID=A0A2S8SSB7_9BACT|nr:GDP-mannose 4,6-dehydratase [Abditibacterium utsteinense]PQV63685.1 CDP-glucose 4,6-dehydratase [Abditibacterium utsteinense]